MSLRVLTVLFSAILATFSVPGQAGVYSDDLAKCLVESTSSDDRVSLVRWMFAVASTHPSVQSVATVPAVKIEEANKAVGELFMRLLTKSCRPQAEKALRYEGAATIEASFNVLGQVAARELFASPEVAEAMKGLEKHVDEEKLQSLLEESQR